MSIDFNRNVLWTWTYINLNWWMLHIRMDNFKLYRRDIRNRVCDTFEICLWHLRIDPFSWNFTINLKSDRKMTKKTRTKTHTVANLVEILSCHPDMLFHVPGQCICTCRMLLIAKLSTPTTGNPFTLTESDTNANVSHSVYNQNYGMFR